MAENDNQAPQGRMTRLKLLFMFAMPALAVLLATLVYYTGVGLPRGTINKGVLVQPPRQIDDLAMLDSGGQSWRYGAEPRGWGILVTGTGVCAEPCRERVTLTRQVRLALGKDTDRLRRYYLASGEDADAEYTGWLAKEQPDLQYLSADAAALRALLQHEGEPDPLTAGTVYLVDPRGFVMMYYLPTHPGRAVLDDLRFLLKNSPD